MKYASKAFRRREREIQRRNSKNLNQLDSDEDDNGNKLNNYEQKRLQNIVDRKNKIAELKIIEKRSELSAEEKERRKRVQREKLSLEPVRKSLRMQNIDAETGLQSKKEPSHYFSSRKSTMDPRWQTEIANSNNGDHHFVFGNDSPRLPLEVMGLENLCEDKEDHDTASNYFDSQIKPIPFNTYEGEAAASIFENIDTLEKNIGNLTMSDENFAKVVPFRIFSLAIHPTESKLLVAAGDKWGSIGFWDVQSSGIQVVKPHSRPVNCMTYDFFDSSKLVSTSYDGTMRIFDINEKKSSVLHAAPEDNESYMTYHTQVDRDCFLVTLGGPGMIALIDRRLSHFKTAAKMKICDYVSPKTVSLHPTKTNVVFLAPIDKGCGIFDMRKQVRRCKGDTAFSSIEPLVHLKDSDDKYREMGISSAFFSPATGNRVVTVGYGSTNGLSKLRLYDTSDENLTKHYGKNYLEPYERIGYASSTGQLVTQHRAEWHPRLDDIFFIGSYQGSRRINVFTDTGRNFSMSSKYLKSVCSIVKCHPSQDIVVGADSYGEVHVFME